MNVEVKASGRSATHAIAVGLYKEVDLCYGWTRRKSERKKEVEMEAENQWGR